MTFILSGNIVEPYLPTLLLIDTSVGKMVFQLPRPVSIRDPMERPIAAASEAASSTPLLFASQRRPPW